MSFKEKEKKHNALFKLSGKKLTALFLCFVILTFSLFSVISMAAISKSEHNHQGGSYSVCQACISVAKIEKSIKLLTETLTLIALLISCLLLYFCLKTFILTRGYRSLFVLRVRLNN